MAGMVFCSMEEIPALMGRKAAILIIGQTDADIWIRAALAQGSVEVADCSLVSVIIRIGSTVFEGSQVTLYIFCSPFAPGVCGLLRLCKEI